MSRPLLIVCCFAALLAAFLLGRTLVECGAPVDHVEWLEARPFGPLMESPEREAAMKSAAEAKVDQYVGVAHPVHYIEWRGWVFVVVSIQPVAGAPMTEYRILAYREIAGEWWVLLDEWRWFTDTRY